MFCNVLLELGDEDELMVIENKFLSVKRKLGTKVLYRLYNLRQLF